jgi:hypothetical protein
MGGKNLEKRELFCTPEHCDYCHPTDEGFKVLANFVYEHLMSSPTFKDMLFTQKV